MKNFTKILMAVPFLAMGYTASAQLDVGCTSVDLPVNGSTIFENLPLDIAYTRENFGDPIAANSTDTINMDIIVDGNLVVSLIRNPANAFATGAVENTGSANPLDLSTLNLPTGNIEVCVATRLSGDNDISNDTSCVTVVNGGAADLGVTNVALVTPATSPIQLGTSITEFQIEYQNFGTSTIPAGTVIPFTFSIGASVLQAITGPANDIAPGGSETVNVDNPPVIPAVPTSPGAFSLCARTSVDNDADPLNDEFCLNLSMALPPAPTVTSYDPDAKVIGGEIKIIGTNFSADPGENEVQFSGSANPVNPTQATTTELTLDVPNGSETGTIDVTVDIGGAGNGQTATGPVFTVLVSDPNNSDWPLGITSNEVRIGNTFYANNQLNVELFNTTNADVAAMTITNIAGQVVSTQQVTIKGQQVMQHVMPVSEMAQGVYILSVETDNNVSSQTKFTVAD